MKNFLVAKITDRKWADKLLDGEVFFRPLDEFGSWNLDERRKSASLNNAFRGDLGEGCVAAYEDFDKSPFANMLKDDIKSIAEDIKIVDDTELRYFKIFCTYCLEIDENNNLVRPDPRLKNFGDTAVLFIDFEEFLKRIIKKELDSGNEYFLMLLDRVSYYSRAVNGELNPLFSKESSYSYQNELRLSLNLLHDRTKNPFARGEIDQNKKYAIELELSRRTVHIDSIRDIAIAMPIDDFLNLRIPNIRYKMGLSPDGKGCIDLMIRDTKEQMKNYKTKASKVQFRIYGK